jgi:hypothetical protein
MKTPTIKRVKSKDGNYIWQVTYANGACGKENIAKSWQAMIFYHQALEFYRNDAGNLKALLHGPDPSNHD